MENKLNNKLDKNTLQSFFKEFIEDIRSSTEKKTQVILNLLNSIKDETEKKITKSKKFLFFNIFFLYSNFIL